MRPVALVLVGTRHLNKRTSRFVESLRASGFEPVVVAPPRHRWDTSTIEDPALTARQGALTMRAAGPRRRWPSRPGLVVCMHWAALPLAMLVGLVTRAPVIYDEHDHYEMLAWEGSGSMRVRRARSRWVHRLHRWSLPRVDLVTCIRLGGGQLCRHLEGLGATVVELHNYPTQRWGVRDRGRRSVDGSIAIVYVGGIWEEKGCVAMLDAYEQLAGDPALPAVSLHAFGRGDPEIERRLAEAAGVTFHGSTRSQDIIDFLVGHDCIGLVLLDATPRYSLVSTNCHKLYEYLAAGVPVLATDVGEMAEIVADLDGGWTIDAGFDTDALAGTLRAILADPGAVRARGDRAATAIEREGLWWDGEWEKVEVSGVLDRAAPRAGVSGRHDV